MSSFGSYTFIGKEKEIEFPNRKRLNSTNESNLFQFRHIVLLDFNIDLIINEKDDALKPMDYLDEETLKDEEEEENEKEKDSNLIIVSCRSETNDEKLYSDLIYSKFF